MTTGVAISTTGDPHRMKFLETCVAAWRERAARVFVTVDGSLDTTRRVAEALPDVGSVFQVGQRTPFSDNHYGRLGVAANKNTGLELLMDHSPCDDLFLCDDDTWPLNSTAPYLHTSIRNYLPHSMVCWGPHRMVEQHTCFVEWSWPRGCLLYMTRETVFQVGGMVEAFGTAGHEHVEYSRRIHQHGITSVPYPSPPRYALDDAYAARTLWHAEDMPLPDEGMRANLDRRAVLSSMRRGPEAQLRADILMEHLDGNINYVPYRAHANSRASATLYQHT